MSLVKLQEGSEAEPSAAELSTEHGPTSWPRTWVAEGCVRAWLEGVQERTEGGQPEIIG